MVFYTNSQKKLIKNILLFSILIDLIIFIFYLLIIKKSSY